tara:strand:- start:387 stop:1703 length:1317 start_codon:yes stop_codon:yes gene_type:complete
MNKMKYLEKSDKQITEIIVSEFNRQQEGLEMIASENFTSKSVMEAVGSVLTNKYAEGYPGNRYYGGCEYVDAAENIAIERAKNLFSSDYANVQPHSGSQANMAVFKTFLRRGDSVLGLDLSHGGHLTHGSKVNFSGEFYDFHSYTVSKKTGRVNFEKLFDLAKSVKPKLIICGGSSYPRYVEFEKFKEIADLVGAYLMADIAHPSGLIAAGIHPSPWPHCDIATTTTHKTLRGPRGGMILAGKNFENSWGVVAPKSGRVKMISELLNSSVMPGIQGGPLMHVIAAKAVAFKEALQPEFKSYCKKVVDNAKSLSECFINYGYDIVTGGTDTHIVLIDLTNQSISGKKAERKLEESLITTNKNMVPYDQRSPLITSGIRIGTPALTTRGMGKDEMKLIAELIHDVLSNINDDTVIKKTRGSVRELCQNFPIYKEFNHEMS